MAQLTRFNGRRQPVHNAKDRTGERFNSVTLTTSGYSGSWFGRCDKCNQEKLYTKTQIRFGTVRCCE